MNEALAYEPIFILLIVFFMVIAFYAILIGILVLIIRWILRINTIVDILNDQASFLEDIKEQLKKMSHSQLKVCIAIPDFIVYITFDFSKLKNGPL